MQLEDLEYIFKPQIDEGTDKLYFTLIDGEYKVIERHPAADLAGLLPMLANFQYHDTVGRFPRFYKGNTYVD